MEPTALLDLFRVQGNIYYIGAFNPPITFLSQQIRALNVVWSLQSTGFQFAGATVAIVGAGLAGVTAASIMARLGANVSVFEKTRDILPLQQGNRTRYVLPNVYHWPDTGSVYPRTHLPYMNWNAGLAGDIATEITNQWHRLGIDAVTANVTRARMHGNAATLHFEAGLPAEFNLILITSGFGIEQSTLAKHTPSYWRNDDLDQPILDSGTFTFFVSGIGDGGLIDALRAKFRDFRHSDFLRWFLTQPWIVEQAQQIDNRLRNDEDPTVVWNDFLNTPHPPEVEDGITSRIRQNANLILSSRHESPMLGDALLSSKMAIAMLLKLGLLTYNRGELRQVKRYARDTFRATTFHEGTETTHMASRVVVRHGPTGTLLNGLILPAQLAQLRNNWPDADDDETIEPMYGPTFLLDEFMEVNMELGFQVTFALGTFHDTAPVEQAPPAAIVAALDLLGNQININNLSHDFTENGALVIPRMLSFPWNGHEFEVSLLPGEISTWRGRCAGPLIVFSTDHRSLLETLLRNDPLQYHSFVYRITNPNGHGHLEESRDFETNVFVFDRRNDLGGLELRSHQGLFQAHRIFSVQSLLEILRNQWTTRRIHDLGWLVNTPNSQLAQNWIF